MTERSIHEGRNVKRIREILGIKQDALALDLGLSQQAVSALEQKEVIDAKILEDVAKVLNVPVEAIKHFNEEATINIISSTLHDNAGSIFHNAVFNPVDKWIEALEKNEKLYEALLKSEREKIALLERMLEKK